MSAALTLFESTRVLPVVVIDDVAAAGAVGSALGGGGLPVIEVTLRTEAALDCLRAMASDPDLVVGVGTVVRPDQVAPALAAGARFVVSPGFSAAVVRECETLGVPVVPGVSTASEMQGALELGLDLLKFFPAIAAGGASMITALAAPFPGVRLLPTGGIGPHNLLEFLRLPPVQAVGGSWMVGADLIATGSYPRIGELAAEAVSIAAGALPSPRA